MVVRHMADRIAVMYLGRIVEIAPTEALFANPHHPYTRALLNVIPLPDPTRRMARKVVEGDVPSPIAPPPGCHFHTRCSFAVERCRVDVPKLSPVDEGRQVACHRWNEIAPYESSGALETIAIRPYVGRLQERFAERKQWKQGQAL